MVFNLNTIRSSTLLNTKNLFFFNLRVYRFDPLFNKIVPGDPKLKSEIFPPCVKHGKKKPIF